MIDEAALFLLKAEESLAGAESEFAGGRYNNCANRCYYACFQAAIFALIRAGVRPQARDGTWGHDFVQSQFAGNLVNQRKLYPSELRNVLARNLELRQAADYRTGPVTAGQASHALRRTQAFLGSMNRS